MAMMLDAIAIGVLLYRPDLRGSSGIIFNSWDVVVLILGITGWLMILFGDFNSERSPPPMPWDHYEVIAAGMMVGVWYVPP